MDNFDLKKYLVENKATLQSRLNEGSILLTSDERNQVEEMIPHLIDAIEGKWLRKDNFVHIGTINIVSADRTPAKVAVYLGNDNTNAAGYYQTNDPKNPDDNRIVIQQWEFANYFNVIMKTVSTLRGDKNIGIELLRKTLKHEIIHAKDPGLNQHKLKEPYDSNKPEVYYKSWTEFQTMTGQFFESIITGVDRIIKSDPNQFNAKRIEIVLNDILNFYSGKTKTFKEETEDFIQDSGSRNTFQELMKFTSDLVFGFENPLINALYGYTVYIRLIKQYHPDAYKEFLTDLYKTIDQCEDTVNKAVKSLNRDQISLEKM